MYSKTQSQQNDTGSHERQMDDMNCIVKGNQKEGSVFLGNVKSATDHRVLQQHKIGAVLSVCPVQKDPKHMLHMILPAQDVDDQDLSQYFESAYNFIEKARQSTNIIIHCQAGISRSTTVLISYLVKKYIIGVREALKMVESKRWQIFPNNGFLKQLAQFERRFFESLVPGQPSREQKSEQDAKPKRLHATEVRQNNPASNSMRSTDFLDSRQDDIHMEDSLRAGTIRSKVEYPRFARYEGMSLYGKDMNWINDTRNQPLKSSVYLEQRNNIY